MLTLSPTLISGLPSGVSVEQAIAAQKAARDELWRAGDLQWMLDEGRADGPQRQIYNRSKNGKSKTFITEAARRTGKTVVHVIIACELALNNPGARINWVQDTDTHIRDSAVPLFEKMCRDAPEDCKGVALERGIFRFPNGAYILFAGANTQSDADRLRGGDDPIANFVDEAGYAAWLRYVYKSILRPAMIRVKRNGHFGMTFVCSSTAEDPAHFFTKLADTNRIKGSYFRATIYDSHDAKRKIAEEAADDNMTVQQFMDTVEFRREFLCERIVDEKSVVFHSFHRNQVQVVQSVDRPVGFARFIARLVSIDPGGVRDPTGVLMGYVDYIKGRIVIEDEILIPKSDTGTIAKEVQDREKQLWPDCLPNQNASRVVDDPTGRFCLDLGQLLPPQTPLRARPATKTDRNTSISLVNNYMTRGQLVIHPRCVNLQLQLLAAAPSKDGRDFKRDENGHQDLCAALMYLIRDAPSFIRNPYPADFDVVTGKELPESHPIRIRREHYKKLQPKTGLAGAFGR